jgi:hypothetical protein
MVGNEDFSVNEILSVMIISEMDSIDQIRKLVQNSLPARFLDENHGLPSLGIILNISALLRVVSNGFELNMM